MDNFDETMKNILGIDPDNPIANTNIARIEEPKPPAEQLNELDINYTDLQSDYISTRENIENILKSGAEAIEEATALLKQTQHPRWAEALATLIKSVSDANKEYLENHRRLSEINRNTGKVSTGDVTVEKGIFVGTGAELVELLNPRNGQKAIIS